MRLYAGAEIVHVGVVAGVVGARVHSTHRPVSLLRTQVAPGPAQHVRPAGTDAAIICDHVYCLGSLNGSHLAGLHIGLYDECDEMFADEDDNNDP